MRKCRRSYLIQTTTAKQVSTALKPIDLNEELKLQKLTVFPALPATANDYLQSASDNGNVASNGTATTLPRNRNIAPPYVELDQCSFQHIDQPSNWSTIKIGDSVELGVHLRNTPDNRKGDFLRIKQIIKDLSTDLITLRGWRLRRNLYFKGMLPQTLNEVCLTLDIDEDDARAPFVQGMEDVLLGDVVRKRRIILTNQPFPALSFRSHTPYDANGVNPSDAKWNVYCSSELVCRWIHLRHFANSVDRHRNRLSQGVLRQIHEREADTGCEVTASALLLQWRGSLPSPRPTAYTFGDAFCGLGGTSEGAAQTGLKVTWAFDHNREACSTYTLNRLGTCVFHAHAHDFLALGDDIFVDVCHFSPPCQPYSPAHTQPGCMDDGNQATLFSVAELLRKARPRVTTLEETAGLLTHHPEWFRALVNMFTSTGYSVRWKKFDFSAYGLAQRRKRLVIFAACPGSILPDFPSPTHGPSLLPFTTIQEAIRPMETAENVTHHNPLSKRICQKAPYDAQTQLRGCITTNGGTGYHPEGSRQFTVRELACLQSIPVNFKLVAGQSDTTITRQIGNAVPPRDAK